MNDIKVSKRNLLEKLRANRSAHRALFEKAQEGYRKRVIALLDQALQEARNGGAIRIEFGLVEPVDQTRDYDRAIGMLEMSVEDEIVVSEREFRCYVQDEWDWAAHAKIANTAYLAG